MRKSPLAALVGASFLLLLVNTAYISAFASPTVFYMGNVLVHLVLGVLVAAGAALLFARRPELRRGFGPAGVLFAVALLVGLFLAVRGNVTANRWALWAHVAAAGLGLAALLPWLARRAGESFDGEGLRRFRPLFVVTLVLLVATPSAAHLYRRSHPEANDRIVNPMVVPTSMDGGGGRPQVPVLPVLGEDQRGGDHPIQLLHGFRGLRRVPPGHL